MHLILIENKPLGQNSVESEYVVIALSQRGSGTKRLYLSHNIFLTELELIPLRTTLFNQNALRKLPLECASSTQ